MTKKIYDIIIIGSGVAGLNLALNLNTKLKILLISKSKLLSGSTKWAQGGIAVALKEGDTEENHVQDTLKAGCYLSDLETVKTVVLEGKNAILELIQKGLRFDSKNNHEIKNEKKSLQKIIENLNFTKEAAHNQNRIVHIGGDQTGLFLQKFLIQKILKQKNIDILEDSNLFQIDSQKNSKAPFFECFYLQKENPTNSKDILNSILTKNIVIATGGSGQIFNNTTNPEVATGDGLKLAKNLGLKIKDMEFYQFHPTGLKIENSLKDSLEIENKTLLNQDFLISEALRGEGAKLLNQKSERFMQKYSQDLELAPRDVVAKAIYQEMQYQKIKQVYLDLRFKGKEYLQKRFPSIYKKCLEYGLDLSKDLIPVAPVAHYQIGGIKTDLKGKTSQKNVFAIGEVASTGLHGANRLASNSLLEGLAFAKIVAAEINQRFLELENDLKKNLQEQKNITIKKEELNLKNLKKNEDLSLLKEEKLEIRNLILKIKEYNWKNIGIIRKTSNLKKHLAFLEKIETEKKELLDKMDWTAQDLKSILITSKTITKAALNRKKSVGSHFIISEESENSNV
jgi:L-aspartate oxidase